MFLVFDDDATTCDADVCLLEPPTDACLARYKVCWSSFQLWLLILLFAVIFVVKIVHDIVIEVYWYSVLYVHSMEIYFVSLISNSCENNPIDSFRLNRVLKRDLGFQSWSNAI